MKTVLYFHAATKTSAPGKIAGVMEIAAKAGWHVQVIEERPNERLLAELIRFWQPLGCIIDCGGSLSDIDAGIFRVLPTVFLDRNPATLPKRALSVAHDSFATAELAAKELLTTGCSNFAFVHPLEERHWANCREQGFLRALALNGKGAAVLKPTGRKGSLAFQRALREFLETLVKPCAVFAANDAIAAETLTAALALGYKVPDELAVIGVDNFADICERTQPTLTSVEPDFQGGGRQAALLLMACVSGGRPTERQLAFGPLRVLRRASTRILAFHDREVTSALDLIAREACLDLTAAKVVKVFSCSRGQAEIRFRKATGRSILEEIHARRLERAKELLRNPNQNLKSICDFCGFRTPGTLRKFFLKETGMTMSAYRAAQRRT